MVATATQALEAAPAPNAARESNPWQPVKRCQTIEEALARLAELKQEGVQSSLLMDSGITVIAHR